MEQEKNNLNNSEEIVYISEAFIFDSFDIQEAEMPFENPKTGKKEKKIKLSGLFQEAGKINGNKRIYPADILEREVHRLSKIILERKGIPMELDHPVVGEDLASKIKAKTISIQNACALLTNLKYENGKVYGEAVILTGDNGMGDKLNALIKNGWVPAVSSRGIGSNNFKIIENEYLVIPDDYRIITWDFVSTPSVHNALLNNITEQMIYESLNSSSYFHKKEVNNNKKFAQTKNLYQILEKIFEKEN